MLVLLECNNTPIGIRRGHNVMVRALHAKAAVMHAAIAQARILTPEPCHFGLLELWIQRFLSLSSIRYNGI